MTVGMGVAPEVDHILGKEFPLRVISFGIDDRVAAAGVETEVPSTNKTKHITLAVNRLAGGRPFHSNDIENWKPIEPFVIRGVVAHVGQDGNVVNQDASQ